MDIVVSTLKSSQLRKLQKRRESTLLDRIIWKVNGISLMKIKVVLEIEGTNNWAKSGTKGKFSWRRD